MHNPLVRVEHALMHKAGALLAGGRVRQQCQALCSAILRSVVAQHFRLTESQLAAGRIHVRGCSREPSWQGTRTALHFPESTCSDSMACNQ